MRTKLAAAVLALGALMATAGLFGALTTVARTLFIAGDAWRTPGSSNLHLKPGRWAVFEETSATGTSSVLPRQISVMGPDGVVPLGCLVCGSSSESITRNNLTFTGIVTFTAPTEGEYKVTVTSDGPAVLVAPSVAEGFIGSFASFLVTGVGVAIAFVGLVWIVFIGATAKD